MQQPCWLVSWNQDLWLVSQVDCRWVMVSKNTTITHYDKELLTIGDLTHLLCFHNTEDFLVTKCTDRFIAIFTDSPYAEFFRLFESRNALFKQLQF